MEAHQILRAGKAIGVVDDTVARHQRRAACVSARRLGARCVRANPAGHGGCDTDRHVQRTAPRHAYARLLRSRRDKFWVADADTPSR
jgi:hypothetical protein